MSQERMWTVEGCLEILSAGSRHNFCPSFCPEWFGEKREYYGWIDYKLKNCCNKSRLSWWIIIFVDLLHLHNILKASGMASAPCAYCPQQRVVDFLESLHHPQHCYQLYKAWKPIVDALDQYHNSDVQKFAIFVDTLDDLIDISMPIFGAGLRYSKEPIAYWTFLKQTAFNPVNIPNSVLIPVVDPVHGPILQVKAVKPLKTGERVHLKYSTVISINERNCHHWLIVLLHFIYRCFVQKQENW